LDISLFFRFEIHKFVKIFQENNFVVLATIKHIFDDDWWYTACTCNKAVYPDSKMFFCEKCNKHVMKVQPRYILCLFSLFNLTYY